MKPDGAFADALGRVRPVEQHLYEKALERHTTLTKPPGSLGRLEALGARLAAIQGTLKPRLGKKAVAVFAADHGVTEAGVSAYPKSVTAAMVQNFLAGGAAINALAGATGAELLVVDVGVDADLEPRPKLLPCKVAYGTKNMLTAPTMSPSEAAAALDVGVAVAQTLGAHGATLLAGGEMGIGNTTAAAALTAFLTGLSPEDITGRGTGLDDAGLTRKIAVIETALENHRASLASPLDALAHLGGLEIAALTGFYVGAAAARVPVVLDGFISAAAALVALKLEPAVKDYLFASHRSQERGHRAQLDALGLEPLFDLELRLGEGSGAVLAFGILEGAAAVLAEMATFAEAGL